MLCCFRESFPMCTSVSCLSFRTHIRRLRGYPHILHHIWIIMIILRPVCDYASTLAAHQSDARSQYSASSSQLRIPTNHIPQQRQPLNSKLHHIRHPIPTQASLYLPRKSPPLTIHRQRHIPRPPILRLAARRPRRPALTQRIRALQIPPHMLCEPGDDIGGGTGVVGDCLLGPASVGDARGERVEG